MKEFAKFDEVKAGDMLIADDGFSCMKEGTTLHVQEDKDGLFVHCIEGKHYLDGDGDGIHIRGFYKA